LDEYQENGRRLTSAPTAFVASCRGDSRTGGQVDLYWVGYETSVVDPGVAGFLLAGLARGGDIDAFRTALNLRLLPPL
jgi:hypothetical protein